MPPASASGLLEQAPPRRGRVPSEGPREKVNALGSSDCRDKRSSLDARRAGWRSSAPLVAESGR